MNDIEKYINQFPDSVQDILRKIRTLIKEIAPQAEESIAYGMPAYKISGKPLVYFAGYKSHIGFYATPSGHRRFKDALSEYKQGKGSVQFPLNQEIPYKLIASIVKFRLLENSREAK